MATIKKNIDGKELTFVTNGLTTVAYNKVFNKDLMRIIEKADKMPLTTLSELAFIANMQAEKKGSDLMRLSEADFYEWVSQFEVMPETEFTDIMTSLNTRGNAIAKNQASPQQGK